MEFINMLQESLGSEFEMVQQHMDSLPNGYFELKNRREAKVSRRRLEVLRDQVNAYVLLYELGQIKILE